MSRIRSLARRGDHMDEAQQVLTGVTEAHAQAQQQGLGCAGGRRQCELHGAYRRPAVSHAAGAGTVFHRLGHGRRAIHAHKGVAAGVKALVRAVCPQHGVQVYDTAEADRHLLAADHPGSSFTCYILLYEAVYGNGSFT